MARKTRICNDVRLNGDNNTFALLGRLDKEPPLSERLGRIPTLEENIEECHRQINLIRVHKGLGPFDFTKKARETQEKKKQELEHPKQRESYFAAKKGNTMDTQVRLKTYPECPPGHPDYRLCACGCGNQVSPRFVKSLNHIYAFRHKPKKDGPKLGASTNNPVHYQPGMIGKNSNAFRFAVDAAQLELATLKNELEQIERAIQRKAFVLERIAELERLVSVCQDVMGTKKENTNAQAQNG